MIRGRDKRRNLKGYERLVAGCLAGATAQTAIYPMEVTHGPCAVCSYKKVTYTQMVQRQPPSFMLITTGAKDPSHVEKNRPVFRTSRLCQTDHTERRSHSLLQGLSTQPAQYCPVRWHRSGRLRGQRKGKRSGFHPKSVVTTISTFFATDPEVLLAEQE